MRKKDFNIAWFLILILIMCAMPIVDNKPKKPFKLLAVLFLVAALLFAALRVFTYIPEEPEHQLREKVPPADVYFGDRSDRWPAVRAAFIKKHPECEACGSRKNLNVHHIKPFHLNPELELDPGNLITLCRTHHFTIGHKSNWKKENPNCRQDARLYREKSKSIFSLAF
jgi:hypothetical protein